MHKAEARRLALTCIAALEGAVILSRAEHNLAPFDDVATYLQTVAKQA